MIVLDGGNNMGIFSTLPAPKNGGLHLDDYYVWCGSVIFSNEDNQYHMFASCWEKELGFGANWLYNSKIAHAISSTPQGPYRFKDFVFERRDRSYFDALNQHNPSIRYHNGMYYLYYMGTTFGRDIPTHENQVDEADFLETWNRKRIGVATSTSINGPWMRRDEPLLQPRDCRYWDCTITTNPSVAILEDGTTYMIYKSRTHCHAPLQLGIAVANKPDGVFERISDEPVFNFQNKDWHIEDPFIWHSDGKFHLIMKDDFKNDCGGITGELGAGVYATSLDCINWDIDHEIAYSRTVTWDDGSVSTLANLERPNLLFHDGKPTHLFLAAGNGNQFWNFDGLTFNVCIPLSCK